MQLLVNLISLNHYCSGAVACNSINSFHFIQLICTELYYANGEVTIIYFVHFLLTEVIVPCKKRQSVRIKILIMARQSKKGLQFHHLSLSFFLLGKQKSINLLSESTALVKAYLQFSTRIR